ncbi:MAG: hypothetical protein Q4D62_13980 [Planctomycetia bacterium]|nr:hypothetical protein [Planctomycetia bacterium]
MQSFFNIVRKWMGVGEKVVYGGGLWHVKVVESEVEDGEMGDGEWSFRAEAVVERKFQVVEVHE